jgi:hypothetical protein
MPFATTSLSLAAAGSLSSVLAALVSIIGVLAVVACVVYRYGPTLCRITGIAWWWAAWACGSQGGFGYMVILLLLGSATWATGAIWHSKRTGYWPSRIAARVLDPLVGYASR